MCSSYRRRRSPRNDAVQLLLATNNPKKVAELRPMLAPLGLDVLIPADVGGLDEVEEDGSSFAENAELKAVSAARATGHWSLADDSGLAVEFLDGAPGVHSARFAGEHGDDAANNRRLLRELEGVPTRERRARFVCALALADPSGVLSCAIEGTAAGRILEAPRGSGDFGYDPIFLFTEEGYEATGRGFAELSPAEKAEVSHRGRALRALLERLPAIIST